MGFKFLVMFIDPCVGDFSYIGDVQFLSRV